MKKVSSKRLAVSATTIRNLSSSQLGEVAGGQTLASCTDLCTSPNLCQDTARPRFCNLDTQFIHGCASG